MTRTNHTAVFLAVFAISAPAAAQQTTRLESGVVAELNALRSDPGAYARKLRVYRAMIGPDGVRHDPGNPIGIRTFEGTASVDEAIIALQKQAPLPPLTMDYQLVAVAQRYAAEQGRTGGTGHVSADGTTMAIRIGRGRTISGALAETISYGEITPADVVRQLIIDDGVASRGHRKILLSPEMRYVGVGCAPHPTYGFACVEDYSSEAIPPVR